ncbi:MAG: hypothetical protein ACE5EM_07730 [Sphingomonadales bacterium]
MSKNIGGSWDRVDRRGRNEAAAPVAFSAEMVVSRNSPTGLTNFPAPSRTMISPISSTQVG